MVGRVVGCYCSCTAAISVRCLLTTLVEAHPSPDFFRRGSEGRVINSIFWGWTLQELSFIMGLFAQDKFLNMSQNACRLSDARCMNHNVNSEFKKISLPKLSA